LWLMLALAAQLQTRCAPVKAGGRKWI